MTDSNFNQSTESGVEPALSYNVEHNTYSLVSTVAYLLGVPQRIFENEHESPKVSIFEDLEKKKHARIMRNLCIVRTAIERNFKQINDAMIHDYKGLMSLPEYVPTEVLNRLLDDGINILRSSGKLVQYIIDINRLIMDRINNCKEYFPIWIAWHYVREIFIMPNGLAEEGTKAAADLYYSKKLCYPYQTYLNWNPKDEGNILYNDKKFITLLYEWNHDEFTDMSKVSDVGGKTKNNIYDFLDCSGSTVIVVDCENSDPYKLCAVLNNLNSDTLDKIAKIILYDDVHSASAWEMLSLYVESPIEHLVIERVKQDKSLVDIRLTAGACREFYQNHVDSFILVSSDSDYWGLISAIPEAHFLVMVEHDKCGPDIKAALSESGIYYCFIDDFYSGQSDDIKINALIRESQKYLKRSMQLNVTAMMQQIFQTTRVVMSEPEKKQFYERYIKPMHLMIEEDGEVVIELKSWK